MPEETAAYTRPECRPKAPLQIKAELVVALLCGALLVAAFGFSELDSDYVTSTRLTAAIQRIVGHQHSKASASK